MSWIEGKIISQTHTKSQRKAFLTSGLLCHDLHLNHKSLYWEKKITDSGHTMIAEEYIEDGILSYMSL